MDSGHDGSGERHMMRSPAMGGGGTTGLALSPDPPPPALSARTAQRRVLVDGLRDELCDADVLWLRGSSGLGKYKLSRLIEARDNGQWAFVSLGDCDAAGQAARMRGAIGGISSDNFAGLILDDLPVPAPRGCGVGSRPPRWRCRTFRARGSSQHRRGHP